jgi:hypothetical protein
MSEKDSTTKRAKYQTVNGQWPANTNDGRDLKPTPKEALIAAKRLYRIGLKKPFRGRMQLTSGNRRTWVRSGVFYVNPDWTGWTGKGGGWHELVHDISHYVSFRMHPNARGHGFQHAFIEKELIKAVVEGGWLQRKLLRQTKAKAPVDIRQVRHQRTLASIKRWQAKEKRARNALRKLKRTSRYYERQMQA